MSDLSAFAQLSAPVVVDNLRQPMRGVSQQQETAARRSMGGRIAPLSVSDLRWYPADVESAMQLADGGDLSQAACLWRATSASGVIVGVRRTRSQGLIRLPKLFAGDEEHVEILRGSDNEPGEFDLLLPPAELALLEDDAIGLGVAVGEFLEVEGRDFPVLSRLPPEFLRFFPSENRWYYMSTAGPLLITPGDGRWVLHVAGGRVAPWQAGIWAAVGAAWIDKLHAGANESNWESKLANPARVASYPAGANENAQRDWFAQVGAWGINTVFEAAPGYKVEILETNGRGSQAFDLTMTRSDREAIIAITGQEVTTGGGAGFMNKDIFEVVRNDLIQGSATTLAHTINTQALPQHGFWRLRRSDNPARVAWDTTSPAERSQIAQSWTALGTGMASLNAQLSAYGQRVAVVDVLARNAVRVEPVDSSAPAINVGADGNAETTTVNEIRKSNGLGPLLMKDGSENPDGFLTLAAHREKVKSRENA